MLAVRWVIWILLDALSISYVAPQTSRLATRRADSGYGFAAGSNCVAGRGCCEVLSNVVSFNDGEQPDVAQRFIEAWNQKAASEGNPCHAWPDNVHVAGPYNTRELALRVRQREYDEDKGDQDTSVVWIVEI